MPAHHGRRLLGALVVITAAAAPGAAAEQEPAVLGEVTVTGTREGELKAETPRSISVLHEDTIKQVKPSHPMEAFSRVPGATVVPTTGEGHTTGIRQPISTEPVYLFLEDGIPTRSTGFFNHNALYEVNIPQADGIEVVRGPGTSLHGSDAIGGVVNVLTKAPSLEPSAEVTLEGGSHGWLRSLASVSNSWGDFGLRGDVNLTHTDSDWRDATGYDRQSATLRMDYFPSDSTVLKTVLSGTNIEQQTGANSRLPRSVYESDPSQNYTPIAFREVRALRLSSAYENEGENSLLSITPYARWNEMELLPPWQLSYEPVVYTTGHKSLGLLAKYRHDFSPWRTRLVGGLDLDYSPGFREEYSLDTVKTGPVFTAYSLKDKIYDYEVVFMQASPYLHLETSPIEALRLTGGLRLDLARYDYENNLTTLQTGRYRRPASVELDYSHLSPSLGATYAITPRLNVFANYKHAFRVPSESQLFRQGSSNDTVDLEPVKVDSYEVGLRGPDRGDFTWEVSAYYMVKDDDILRSRDFSGTTYTNAGRTEHQGVELGLGWRFLEDWLLTAAWSYSEHSYDSWQSSAGDYSGKEIPSAPNVVGDMTLAWTPAVLPGSRLEAEWVHMSEYWIDDENTAEYDGHDLLHLRASYDLTPGLSVFARVFNATDELWATTGAVIRGVEEFAPGMPRTFYGGITARF